MHSRHRILTTVTGFAISGVIGAFLLSGGEATSSAPQTLRSGAAPPTSSHSQSALEGTPSQSAPSLTMLPSRESSPSDGTAAGIAQEPSSSTSTPPNSSRSPFGEAPLHERPAPTPPAEQRAQAEAFVAEDPQDRVLCEKPDGSVTVIIGRRVDPTSKMEPPAAADCRGGK